MKVFRIIAIISRVLVGLVFIFSGFVKMVDPLGSTYKFVDYFNAFHMSFMEVTAFPFAVIMSLAEFIIGVSLLLGLRMRQAAWAVLAFMSFFTILTFFLALYNPVSDCGCFGDAFIMTNWETFGKNIIISVFVAIIFIYRNKYKAFLPNRMEWVVVTVFSVFGLWISVYCYHHLPIIDFRPYKVGKNITEGMIIPESEKNNIDQYETTLFYKKDGIVKEFNLKNLPDSTWQWVETKNVLIKEGYHPPIHNFSLSNEEGSDVTDIVLSDSGYTFLLVTYNIGKASKEMLKKMNSIHEWSTANNIKFICLTGSSFNDVKKVKNEIGALYDFYTVDEITLKTIIRSNPGLVLIKHGTILAKWHFNDIPDAKVLKEDLLQNVSAQNQNKAESLFLHNLILFFLLITSLIFLLKFYLNNKKTSK